MTQQTGIAGVVESASTEHNAPVQHRWDDLDYVRQVIASGGSYNALEVLYALDGALLRRNIYESAYYRRDDANAVNYKKRRRALLWLVAERKRRREAEASFFNLWNKVGETNA